MLLSFIIGLVAGWVANMWLREGSYGLIANLIVGLVGALLGSWIAQMVSFDGLTVFWVICSSIIGAAVLLTLVAMVAKRQLRRGR